MPFLRLWRRGGFTLVETLVVISIIALLVSLLLPSLSRSFQVADMQRCASNQRGIGVALWQYATENNDYTPLEPPQDMWTLGTATTYRSGVPLPGQSIMGQPLTIGPTNPVATTSYQSRPLGLGVLCAIGSQAAKAPGWQSFEYMLVDQLFCPTQIGDMRQALVSAALGNRYDNYRFVRNFFGHNYTEPFDQTLNGGINWPFAVSTNAQTRANKTMQSDYTFRSWDNSWLNATNQLWLRRGTAGAANVITGSGNFNSDRYGPGAVSPNIYPASETALTFNRRRAWTLHLERFARVSSNGFNGRSRVADGFFPNGYTPAAGTAQTFHPDGGNVMFGDGSVRFFTDNRYVLSTTAGGFFSASGTPTIDTLSTTGAVAGPTTNRNIHTFLFAAADKALGTP